MSKTIENKTTTLPGPNGEGVKYAELLTIAFNKPTTEGIDLVTMRKNLRIIGILEEDRTKDTLTFEDEDFKLLANAVKTSTWAVNHLDILEFSDYIEECAKGKAE